jgi:hypothetical protein
MLREIERISDRQISYFGAYVQKPTMPHLHLALDIAPGTPAWNALAAWAKGQNGRGWLSRVRFEEIIADKGGLPGLIAYFIGPENLNKHPGQIMRSTDLIKAINAIAAEIPAKARRSAADASEGFQGLDVAPEPPEALPEPSYGLDAIDHPPAEPITLPAGDQTQAPPGGRCELDPCRCRSPVVPR